MKRFAEHAGSWYSDSPVILNKELQSYFDKVSLEQPSYPIKSTRAVIAPHAGFSYSGPTAAYAYKAIDTLNIKRVFILGPSHHAFFQKCNLPVSDEYETPFGDLQLDKKVIKELYETGKFGRMTNEMDEKEHSIEMHLPFIYKTFEENIDDITVVPILVGAVSKVQEKMYGELLADYLKDSENLFIISSDFCHWGTRFRYTYYTEENDHENPIHLTSNSQVTRSIDESIEELDYRALDTIESLSFSDFHVYLEETENTICGRHPIAVLLAALEELGKKEEHLKQTLKCIKYDFSGPCEQVTQSRVSYASMYVQIE